MRTLNRLALLTVFTLTITYTLHAQWSRDPAEAIQLNGIHGVILVSDSLGGVFLSGYGANERTYCYYIDSNGYPRWNEWVDTAPLAVASLASGIAISPQTGFLITVGISIWQTDDEEYYWDLRAQKINAAGEFMWPDSGVSLSDLRLTSEDHAQFSLVGIESDAQNGVIISWVARYYDQGGNLVRQPFRAQRISADGELLWGETGVEVVRDNRLYSRGRSISDGNGGIILVHYTGGLGAQRITADGERPWGAGVEYEFEYAIIPVYAIPDGSGGAIISAKGFGEGALYVNLFRLNSEGERVWRNNEGLIVRTTSKRHDALGYLNSYLNFASPDNIFVNWSEHSSEMPHPLVQSVSLNGEINWDNPGIEVSSADSTQFGMIGTASYNSVIYSWLDRRDINGQSSSVFAQRIDFEGRRLWGDNDVLFFNHRALKPHNVISDMNGGAIFQFSDSFLQHINRNGELGIPLSIRNWDQPLSFGVISYTLFPNPANSQTIISFSNTTNNRMFLKIFDIQGRNILSSSVPLGVISCPLDLTVLSTGNYFLHIQSGAAESVRTLKIIK